MPVNTWCVIGDETLVKFVLRNYIYMNRTREKEKGDTFCTVEAVVDPRARLS